ncbi:MAG: hypothetical protein JNM43_10900 [Planctomycetaceae bacterium]|nr:hypothetical protein [Planctomycetaceae bacterium]
MNIQWKKLIVAAVLVAVGAMNSANAVADKGRGGNRQLGSGGSSQGQRQVAQKLSGQGNFGSAQGTKVGNTLSLPSNTLSNQLGGQSAGRTRNLPFQNIAGKKPILAGTPISVNPIPTPFKPPITKPGIPLNPLPGPGFPIKPIKPTKPPIVINPGGPLNPFPMPPIKPLPPINPNPNPIPPTPPINPNPPGGGHGGGHGHGNGHGCNWHHHWNHWVGCINVYFPCPRVIQPCPLPCVGQTVIVTPVVTDTLVTRLGIDLAVREVKVLSLGNATEGTLYRVLITNNGSMDMTGEARIALFAVGDAQPDASTPQVLGTFNGLKAGETAIVDVRMPVAGNALPNLLVAVEIPEGVQDLNEANNVAIGEVAKLPVEVAAN